jgi:serine protease Do
LLAAPAGPARARAPEAPPSEPVERAAIEAALAKVRPALVKLTVISLQYTDGRAMRYPSSGSGVVVSAAGDVLTNYHVAGRSARIQATLFDGRIVDAEVVAHDALTDLSVLRLRLPPGSPPLAAADFAEGAPEVGDPVLALGSPLTLASSVTLGIVSNTRRVFTDFVGTRLEDLDLGGEPTGLFTQWIQHDALILPGNSGGPLVDLEGAIVGINELGGGGVGFAIPASIARRVLESALAEGRVRRSDLGLGVLPVAKLERSTGALVAFVVPGSPAAAAGVQPGDVLLELGGVPVAVRFFEEVPELYRRVSQLPIGREVELVVERDGRRRSLAATTTELEEALGAEAESAELGVTVQELTTPMALMRQLPPRSGLVVTSLRPAYPAAEGRPAVAPGDLITGVGERATTTLAELDAALDAASGEELLLRLRRDDEFLLSVVRRNGTRGLRSGGELPRAWLGVQTQVVTPALAGAIGRPELRGFRITQVMPWSAAEAAGLEVGDVVVAVDGEPLEVASEQDAEDLRRTIEERSIGARVRLGVERGGERRELTVALDARPRGTAEARTRREEGLGFAVREITLFDRVEFHWARDQQGVLVTEVVPGGWAQMAGLASNDLVLAIGGREIRTLDDLERTLAAVAADRPTVVPLFVRRGSRTHFVFLEPDWRSSSLEREGS